jgi:NAD(P)H-hydrate epimerase
VGLTAHLIRVANAHDAPALALDIPSGVAPASGIVYDPAIHAQATLTLALPKEGLRRSDARGCVGELYLGDIGVPPELYARAPLQIDVGPVFATGEIVQMW